jgi:hypothetical protein
MQIRKLLTTVFFLTSSQALAGIVTYTSSAAFQAALAGSTTTVEDYGAFSAGVLINPGTTLDGITYDAFNLQGLGTQGVITNQFNSFSGVSLGGWQSGGAHEFFFDGNSIDISFAPAFAIGVFFNVNANSGNFGIHTSIGDATTGSASYDTSSFVFVGLISTDAFTSAELFSNSGGAGTASFNIPAIIRAEAPAPEPASMTVTALGVGLLAAFLRRRRIA